MNEPQQLPLLKVNLPPQAARPVEYVPPAPEEIDQYIQSVCKELTQKKGTNHCDTDFIRGLTTFMQVIVRIQIGYLNRGVEHDPKKD
jgi:hypothetical protein